MHAQRDATTSRALAAILGKHRAGQASEDETARAISDLLAPPPARTTRALVKQFGDWAPIIARRHERPDIGPGTTAIPIWRTDPVALHSYPHPNDDPIGGTGPISVLAQLTPGSPNRVWIPAHALGLARPVTTTERKSWAHRERPQEPQTTPRIRRKAKPLPEPVRTSEPTPTIGEAMAKMAEAIENDPHADE